VNETIFNLTTTGERGEVIGTPSFLLSDRGYAMDGTDALHELWRAVNAWFMEAPIEEARAEVIAGTEDYNWGDLLCSSRVLSGLAAYGITALDGEVPAGGPYRLADATEQHHEKLLDSDTLRRVLPEYFDDGFQGTAGIAE